MVHNAVVSEAIFLRQDDLSRLLRKYTFVTDKQGHEVDFVLASRRDELDAIECSWHADAFDGAGLALFRSYLPKGRNYQ